MWNTLRILGGVALVSLGLPAQVIQLKPTAAFDASASLSVQISAATVSPFTPGRRSRSLFFAGSSGPVLVRLGNQTRMVFLDRNGHQLSVSSVDIPGPVGAQWSALSGDNTTWIGAYVPAERTTKLEQFRSDGTLVSVIGLSGPISGLAASGSSLMITSGNIMELGRTSGNNYQSDARVPLVTSVSPGFPVALGPRSAAIVDQSSGNLQVVDFDAKNARSVMIQSPALTRSIDFAQKEEAKSTVKGSARVVVLVVVSAASDQQGNLFYLLGPQFSVDSATVLKTTTDGQTSIYDCQLAAGVAPEHIAVAGSDLYLADALGKGMRFDLNQR